MNDLVLITTTINVPRVLALYRRYMPYVEFIVAGDKKSPHDEILSFMHALGGKWQYLQPDDQARYKCSELIGWDCIQRRNIALLEALRNPANQTILTIDDDNLPMGSDYFYQWQRAFTDTYSAGLELTPADCSWVDYGILTGMRQRGIPAGFVRHVEVRHALDRKVGAATGMILGDPDINAVDRFVVSPVVTGVHELARAGVTVDPNAHTVFNTQNTAFLRKFAPAMFCLPGVGRYDDIFASLICLRVMREEGYCLHVGQPFVYQQRNAHDLYKDMRAEIPWMDKVEPFARALDGVKLDLGESVVDRVRTIYDSQASTLLPVKTIEAALAWCDDCEEVMK